jgi:hypothetical protein
MNILAPTTAVVNATVRQPDFVAAIFEAEISPYMLGVLDAERGETAVPEMYFTQRGQMCEYCEGYEAVAGRTITTGFFLTVPPVAVTVAPTASDIEATLAAIFAPVPVDDSQLALDLFDYEGELEDLQDDMADREFHGRGAW